jgi:hypothetical protein
MTVESRQGWQYTVLLFMGKDIMCYCKIFMSGMCEIATQVLVDCKVTDVFENLKDNDRCF